jgi:CubicO group peptidase (beta-lactamase class C family)
MSASDPRQALFELLESAVGEVFPGCVALVWRDGATLYHEAHGTVATHPWVPAEGKPVVREQIYDLASLTKVLCTTSLTALAVSEGVLELDAPVPEPWNAGCPGATLADLLEHCSGYEAHREYFGEVEPYSPEGILERIAATPPGYPLRSKAVYSDLGFMVLGRWLEQAYGRDLEVLFTDKVMLALGLDDKPIPHLGFHRLHGTPPPPRPHRDRIAPTEVYDPALYVDAPPSHFELRKNTEVAHGFVHDDNAFVWGGVAGHAGLFGTAHGVLEVAKAWLLHLLPGLAPAVRDRFWQPSTVPGSTRRLGWDGPSADGTGTAGNAVSQAAVGHTGFTGTSVWIDPESKGGPTICVLLSNRVHPVRTATAIKAFRPRFHEAAFRL